MTGRIALILMCLSLAGCATRASRSGVMSDELPLTVDDISDIRAGEKNHEKILEEYFVVENPKLQTYLNEIASKIAEVSNRPNLPYKVVILDEAGVDIFGGPGGYIYMTKGLLEFVQSESEVAGVLAHEIAHIAGYGYSEIPQTAKMKKLYGALLAGTELASDAVGSYGTAANKGLRAVGKAAPAIKKRFTHDEEMRTDKYAIDFIIKAGYDPRAYREFVNRLSKVPMQDVNRFVDLLNGHPPFPARQKQLEDLLKGREFEEANLEFKPELLNEIIPAPPPVAEPIVESIVESATPPSNNIVFSPKMNASPEMEALEREKAEKLTAVRKQRNAWF